jgi:hypothetical protein
MCSLTHGFHFYGALLGELDPFKRHQRFLYNVALFGVGYRRLERSPVEQGSYTMNIGSGGRGLW